jgi:preprotein translocase subunit SecE
MSIVKDNIKDLTLWSSIACITFCVFGIIYGLHLSESISALLWTFWVFAASGLALFTNKGRELRSFIIDAKAEIDKVVWPNRQETVQTTGVVILMVVIAGFVLWGIDSVMIWFIGKLTHLG